MGLELRHGGGGSDSIERRFNIFFSWDFLTIRKIKNTTSLTISVGDVLQRSLP